MIMGNHEHYHGDFAKSAYTIGEAVKHYDNFHFLEKQSITIGDYLFIGGTLWTDFNGEDPLTLWHARQVMHDFQGVANSHTGGRGKFLPEHALEDHHVMRNYISEVIADRRTQGEHSDRVIVVGHHSPSRQSTHPRYQSDYQTNGCYSSNMDSFILDHPEICLWTHGHTHEDFDYMIGTTRVVCNPRGYINYEDCADNFKLKYVEI